MRLSGRVPTLLAQDSTLSCGSPMVWSCYSENYCTECWLRARTRKEARKTCISIYPQVLWGPPTTAHTA